MNSIYVTPIPSIVFIHSAVNFRVFLVDQSSSPVQTFYFIEKVTISNEKFAVTLLYEDGTPVKDSSSAMVIFMFFLLILAVERVKWQWVDSEQYLYCFGNVATFV